MTRQTVAAALCVVGSVLALCGCDQLFGLGGGDKGGGSAACSTTFQWANCPGANWCELTNPLAVGASGVIRTAEGCGWTTVKSTNAAVASATVSATNELTVNASTAGTTTLTLSRGTGTDMMLAIVVAAPDHLIADGNFAPGTGPTVVAGSVERLHVAAASSTQPLVGSSLVKFTLSGSLVAYGADADPSGGLLFSGQAGSGLIVASTGALNMNIPVEVIDGSQVTAVNIAPTMQSDANSATLLLDVTVLAGATPVYVAPCTWVVASGGALSQVAVAGGTFATTPTTRYTFTGDPGSYVLTCEIAGQQRDYQVQL